MLVGKSLISSIDYPGCISLVLFLSKCPLRCKYCYNTDLLFDSSEVSIEVIKELILKDLDFIDAVVISGGEPLLQYKEVLSVLEYVKSIGLKTKLDTSGIYPKHLKMLLPFLDYVALDVKAPFNKYESVTGSDIGDNVKESIDLINSYGDVIFECRTTYSPELLSVKDIQEISSNIVTDYYTLQQFINENPLDDSLVIEPSYDDLKEIAIGLNRSVKIKTKEFGEEIL